MRREVRDMAQRLADSQLEGLEYMSVIESQEDFVDELSDDEAKWVFEAVVTARTTLDPALKGQIERLQFTIRKLAGHAGHDISEIVDEGWLEEGDMD